jgi:hypothetical protein
MLPVFHTELYHADIATYSDLVLPALFAELYPAATAISPKLMLHLYSYLNYPATATSAKPVLPAKLCAELYHAASDTSPVATPSELMLPVF